MPYAVNTITTVDSDYKQEFRYRIDGGILNAVTLRNAGSATGNNMAYAQVWLCLDDTPTNTDGIVLAAGPLGASGAVFWTGNIHVSSPMAVRVELWIDFVADFQIVALTTHKQPKTNGTENATT